jgi:hypothetical protein
MYPKIPRTIGRLNHLVNPGTSEMRDTQYAPSAALLMPSGIPGSMLIRTSLLPALGWGGRYSLRGAAAAAEECLMRYAASWP